MNQTTILKALADESRMKILKLLLAHNYCVRSLAKNMNISEAAVSQHLKIMREAGLLIGEKRGYFMHYSVERDVLRWFAKKIAEMADIEQKPCTPEEGGCKPTEQKNCHMHGKNCDSETQEFCHGSGEQE